MKFLFKNVLCFNEVSNQGCVIIQQTSMIIALFPASLFSFSNKCFTGFVHALIIIIAHYHEWKVIKTLLVSVSFCLLEMFCYKQLDVFSENLKALIYV